MKIRKCVIPAAGLGTRLLPASKAVPKEMLPVVDTPVLELIVKEAVDSGIEEILIITGRDKSAIENHFDNNIELEDHLLKKNDHINLDKIDKIVNMARIFYTRQNKPLGLGHAILCAKEFIGNEPFAILLGDDIMRAKKPVTKQLIDCFNTYNAPVLGVQEVDESDINKYGIIDYEKIEEDTFFVNDMIEKPKLENAPSNKAILGRYVLTPEIFDILENQKPGVGGEIQLTDAIRNLLDIQKVYAYQFEGKRYDTGSKIGYLKAIVEFALVREDLSEEFEQYLKALLK
ncbi:MAG: UTP--glucose-1-phosphate uridylyltransferase GalU [Tissierellia bacterium]|nr:UTP--glucose-1-phosphate uridylyltransferase GalU [Tissierellia bacterium]